MRPKRILGYARVSSAEQALGTSLQDQQDAITRYAETCGVKVTRFYVEAESAVYEKIERRDQIRALMEDVRSGDLIVCDKLDRWSRDPEFTYGSVRRILQSGAAFYAVTDQCDPSTQEGDTMLGFRVLVAREEHKRIRQRTVGTRKLLRDKGYYAEGLPPFGYSRSLPRGAKGLQKNILQINAHQADLVRELFDRCADGDSINDLLAWLSKAHRAKKWDKKVINTILRNRVYIGEVKNASGLWIKGQHQPIVTVEQYSLAQDGLDRRRLRTPEAYQNARTANWLVRKIAVCALCGARVATAYGGKYKPSPGTDRYISYYACQKRCGAKYVPVEETDEVVSAMALRRLEELVEFLSKPPKQLPRRVVDFAARRQKLQDKRSRFLEAFADGMMSRDELRAKLDAVDVDIGRLTVEEAEALKLTPANDSNARADALRTVKEIRSAWRKVPKVEKRRVLHLLARQARIARGREPAIDWFSAEEIASGITK